MSRATESFLAGTNVGSPRNNCTKSHRWRSAASTRNAMGRLQACRPQARLEWPLCAQWPPAPREAAELHSPPPGVRLPGRENFAAKYAPPKGAPSAPTRDRATITSLDPGSRLLAYPVARSRCKYSCTDPTPCRYASNKLSMCSRVFTIPFARTVPDGSNNTAYGSLGT
jgi:hypothetical protein